MLYLVITVGFQMNYLYMFWVVGSRTCLFPLSAPSPSDNFANLFLTMPLVVEHPRDLGERLARGEVVGGVGCVGAVGAVHVRTVPRPRRPSARVAQSWGG